MKIGDLVRRVNVFQEWVKHNPWMASMEVEEIGIVTKIEKNVCQISTENYIVVMWPITGLSWEATEDLRMLSETL